VERVDLTYEHGVSRLLRWDNGWIWGPFVTVVTVGRLADGRWFAQRYGRGANRRDLREGACVYAGDRRGEFLAMATARRWMRTVGGTWRSDDVGLRAPAGQGGEA
jgi:hypothetical protein